jgi:hypothetical protein
MQQPPPPWCSTHILPSPLPLLPPTPTPHFRHADVQFTNNPAKYIKYSAGDVGSIIDDDLFETKAVSMNKLSLTKEKLGAIV